jgi:uroporphyrinogen-III synthase
VKVAAVGPSTAAALEESGWTVHRVPIEGRGKGLVDAFREAGDALDARVFFPASALARPEIPEGLEALGASVHQCMAYQMVYLPLDPSACRAALDKGEVDAVTFASPSAMEGLRRALGSNLFNELARSLPAAAIGPTTAAALRDVGWREVVVGKSPTLEALVDAAAQAVTFVGR